MKKYLLVVVFAFIAVISSFAKNRYTCYASKNGNVTYWKIAERGKTTYFTVREIQAENIKIEHFKITDRNGWIRNLRPVVKMKLSDTEVESMFTKLKQYTFVEQNQVVDIYDSCSVTITCVSPIKTSTAIEGNLEASFIVSKANNKDLIGKPVVVKIMHTRKSNISGSEGRLIIRPLYIINDNNKVDLELTDIYVRGKNRTNVKFWLSGLIVPIFIPGKGAKIYAGTEYKVMLK